MPVATYTIAIQQVAPGFIRGTYTCNATPAATNIYVGFAPSFILYWNETDGTNFGMWAPTVGAAKAITNVTTGGPTLLGTNGITALSDTTGAGFTIGTGTGVQTASKVYGFIAFR